MIPEARLQDTGAGLVPSTPGWFVLNARDARWIENPGRGHSLPLTGVDEHEAETFFAMLPANFAVRTTSPSAPPAARRASPRAPGAGRGRSPAAT